MSGELNGSRTPDGYLAKLVLQLADYESQLSQDDVNVYNLRPWLLHKSFHLPQNGPRSFENRPSSRLLLLQDSLHAHLKSKALELLAETFNFANARVDAVDVGNRLENFILQHTHASLDRFKRLLYEARSRFSRLPEILHLLLIFSCDQVPSRPYITPKRVPLDESPCASPDIGEGYETPSCTTCFHSCSPRHYLQVSDSYRRQLQSDSNLRFDAQGDEGPENLHGLVPSTKTEAGPCNPAPSDFSMLNVTEKELIEDILYVLQGIEGRFVKVNPAASNAFMLLDTVRVSNAVRQLVNRTCIIGQVYRDMKSVQVCPGLCRAALHEAISQHLAQYRIHVNNLATTINASNGNIYGSEVGFSGGVSDACSFHDGATNIASTEASVTRFGGNTSAQFQGNASLASINVWVQEPYQRLRLLHQCLEALSSDAVDPLDFLYSTLCQRGDLNGRQLYTQLYKATLMPFIETVCNWMFRGQYSTEICSSQGLDLANLERGQHPLRLPKFISKEAALEIYTRGKWSYYLSQLKALEADVHVRQSRAIQELCNVDNVHLFQESLLKVANSIKSSESLSKLLLDKYKFVEVVNKVVESLYTYGHVGAEGGCGDEADDVFDDYFNHYSGNSNMGNCPGALGNQESKYNYTRHYCPEVTLALGKCLDDVERIYSSCATFGLVLMRASRSLARMWRDYSWLCKRSFGALELSPRANWINRCRLEMLSTVATLQSTSCIGSGNLISFFTDAVISKEPNMDHLQFCHLELLHRIEIQDLDLVIELVRHILNFCNTVARALDHVTMQHFISQTTKASPQELLEMLHDKIFTHVLYGICTSHIGNFRRCVGLLLSNCKMSFQKCEKDPDNTIPRGQWLYDTLLHSGYLKANKLISSV